jgi:hypothetical protein
MNAPEAIMAINPDSGLTSLVTPKQKNDTHLFF